MVRGSLRRKIPIVPVPAVADLIADEEKRRARHRPVIIGDESRFFTTVRMQR